MSFRGMGGYYLRGDYGYGRRRRGDLMDFSDVIGGSSTDLSAPDVGGSIWGDVGSFLGDIGLTGPVIGQTIFSGVKGLLGGGGGANMPGGTIPTGAISAIGGKSSVAGAPRGARLPRAGGRRRPHMNPLNPRALRRALRRAQRFEHFARSVVHLTSPKKHVSGFRFKRHRKRRC